MSVPTRPRPTAGGRRRRAVARNRSVILLGDPRDPTRTDRPTAHRQRSSRLDAFDSALARTAEPSRITASGLPASAQLLDPPGRGGAEPWQVWPIAAAHS